MDGGWWNIPLVLSFFVLFSLLLFEGRASAGWSWEGRLRARSLARSVRFERSGM